jgi:hypothetical protein
MRTERQYGHGSLLTFKNTLLCTIVGCNANVCLVAERLLSPAAACWCVALGCRWRACLCMLSPGSVPHSTLRHMSGTVLGSKCFCHFPPGYRFFGIFVFDGACGMYILQGLTGAFWDDQQDRAQYMLQSARSQGWGSHTNAATRLAPLTGAGTAYPPERWSRFHMMLLLT